MKERQTSLWDWLLYGYILLGILDLKQNEANVFVYK